MKKGYILKAYSYSPGYSDMRGAYHYLRLAQNKEGEWRIISEDREYYNAPTVITEYEVSKEDVLEFENFILTKHVVSLSKRLKSKRFITDYSPWSITIDLENTKNKKVEYYTIPQYNVYTPMDYKKIEKLKELFNALQGKVISEKVEKND